MAVKKDSVPAKIAILLFFGVVIILLSGYFSYRSLASVVRLIYKESKPHYGLTTIRDISSDIERAENYVRLYGLTKKQKYLYGYRKIASNIDSEIDSLYNQYPNDDWFSHKIDTIQNLFAEKTKIWREMVYIWQLDTTNNVISELAKEIQPPEPDTLQEMGFIKNLFTKNEEPEPLNNEKILERIVDLEKTEKETGLRLQRKETELTESSNSLNEAFLSLTGQLEEYEKQLDIESYERAGEMADKMYILVAIFSLSATLVSILVLFVIIKYVRKNREYNNALIQSRQETEDLSKAKELFLANVSHEIRTPLNAITGFIQQLMAMPLDVDVRDKLKIVDSASNQLLRLINDILDFSKLQAGKLTLHNVHFNPEKVIKNVCAVFSESAKKKKTKLNYRLESDNYTLFGDSNRFQQILYNLLSNAIKFTEEGDVDVCLQICPKDNNSAIVKLIVKDTGLGIETSKLDKIFKDFTQEDQEIAVKYGGTGLGLSIVKELAELFNGKVSVDSKKGFGTIATCKLVFQMGDKKKIAAQATKKKVFSLTGNLRFLVADDEEYNRLLIATILDKWEANYDMVTNGVDAIELLQTKQYDFILTDIRMPEIDGIMVAKFIRETLNLSKDTLPVVGVTADISGKITEEERDLFNTFLIKPFTEEDLMQPLSITLKGKRRAPHSKSKQTISTQRNGDNSEIGNLDNLLRIAGNDLKFVEEMLVQFETSTKKGLEEMQVAIENNDFIKVGELAHKLAPPSRHLGLEKLLAQFKEIEKHASGKNRDNIICLISEANQNTSQASMHLLAQFNKINK